MAQEELLDDLRMGGRSSAVSCSAVLSVLVLEVVGRGTAA